MNSTPGKGSGVTDARSIITEDSFRIAPELLGMPLARPWRRACAMAVDGLFIALLANTPGFLLALAGSIVLFRATAPSRATGYVRGSIRMMFRFSAAVMVFALLIVSWGRVSSGTRAAGTSLGLISERTAAAPERVESRGVVGPRLRSASATLAFLASADESEAHDRAARLVSSLRRQGATTTEIRSLFLELREQSDHPWLTTATDSALQLLSAAEEERAVEPPIPTDSLVTAYVASQAEGDSGAAAAIRAQLGASIAADELQALREEVQRGDTRIAALRSELDEAQRERGILAFLRRLAEDLGLGFGWAGLYFTAFVALWNGRTPGKRLMSIKVIRLDGRPVGWRMAFERFGGYAASIATGLLGFAQILWDRNRQAIHDKIAETVVVKRG
jgi:hypothetical protein